MEKSKKKGAHRSVSSSSLSLSLSLSLPHSPEQTDASFEWNVRKKNDILRLISFIGCLKNHKATPGGFDFCRRFEKEGTSRWATFGWDRQRSPDVVFEHKERCPQTGFLRKKEGYFGVGFFLSPLSPPPHRPSDTRTPQPPSKIGFFGKKAPWGWFLLGRKFSQKILVKPTKRPCIEVSALR